MVSSETVERNGRLVRVLVSVQTPPSPHDEISKRGFQDHEIMLSDLRTLFEDFPDAFGRSQTAPRLRGRHSYTRTQYSVWL